MNYRKWYIKNASTLVDRVVVVTGATGGIGKETCRHLLGLNATVIMACRNMEKSQAVKAELLNEFPNSKIEILKLDVGEISSIDQFICSLKNSYPMGVDYFINNAGVYQIEAPDSDETGLDMLFQTNFFGPMYMTKKLMPYLNQKNCKIIFVESISYKFQKINFTDIDYKGCHKKIKKYGNTKRWLMYGVNNIKSMAEDKYKRIQICVVHPGVTTTNIFRKPNGKALSVFYKIVLPIMKVIFESPKKASLNVVDGLFLNTTDNEWIGPNGLLQVWGTPTTHEINDLNGIEQENVDEFITKNIDKIISK